MLRTKPPSRLRHDTPVDVPAAPAAYAPRAMPPFNPGAAAEQALERVQRIETISGAYEAWLELRLEHAAALLKLADERSRLEQQGEFLVGAVRAARDLKQAPSLQEALALAKNPNGLDSFVVETAARLQAAKRSLAERTQLVAVAFGDAFAQIRQELRARIRRTLEHVRPRLKLMIRALGPDRRILHVVRLQPEESVLLAWVLLERLPSRYDFLFDDSTDDASLPPPTLYAEEGLSSAQLRPGPGQLKTLLARQGEVLPIKGALPFFVPGNESPSQLIRLVERGPVMEAEIGDGEVFRNVLSRDEAERIAGYFLRLKLENKVEIELADG